MCIKFGIIFFSFALRGQSFWFEGFWFGGFVHVKLNYFQALERFIIPYNHGIHNVREVIYWKDLQDNLWLLYPYFFGCLKVQTKVNKNYEHT